MMRNKIRLDTIQDATEFANIATTFVDHKITVTDGEGLTVNAKSVLGMVYSLEFDELYVESDIDIYHAIEKFIIM